MKPLDDVQEFFLDCVFSVLWTLFLLFVGGTFFSYCGIEWHEDPKFQNNKIEAGIEYETAKRNSVQRLSSE